MDQYAFTGLSDILSKLYEEHNDMIIDKDNKIRQLEQECENIKQKCDEV